MTEAIRVENLVKKFGSLVAVDDISFSVEQGEIFGILGPNGAGKTTTLEIIEGLQQPTGGRTYRAGHGQPEGKPGGQGAHRGPVAGVGVL